MERISLNIEPHFLVVFVADNTGYMKLQEIGGQCRQIYIHFSWERLPAAKKSRFLAVIA